MKLFVDCDADTRLSRRVLRDMNEFARPLDNILQYYQKYVKPTFEEFCLPTKKYADVIIPRGAENMVALNLIVQHLNEYLNNTSHHVNSSDSDTNNSSWNNQNDSGLNVTTPLQRSPVASTANLSPSSSFAISPNKSHTDLSSRPH